MTPSVLIGLPGLYQNWLMAAVDTNSKLQLHGDRNFFCSSSRVKWIIKLGLDEYPVASNELIVLNLYVNTKNIPWYLYNLFEKTYDIKVMVDNLVDDLIEKGDKFTPFKLFKNKIVEIDTLNFDTAVAFFYDYFKQQNDYLFTVLPRVHENYINIEYDDFSDRERLAGILSLYPEFNIDHYNSLYTMMAERNLRYLNRKNDFITKFDQTNSFDIIELGYIGYLADKILNKELDWANPKLRNSLLKSKAAKEIKDFAVSMC